MLAMRSEAQRPTAIRRLDVASAVGGGAADGSGGVKDDD